MSRLMHRRWVKVLVICFSTGILLSVNIQAAEAPLPIEAQKAFERGLIAADQQAWHAHASLLAHGNRPFAAAPAEG